MRPATAAKGPWRILGLAEGATPAEVRRAYRALARRFHPDAHPHASESERRALAARFDELTRAYRAIVA